MKYITFFALLFHVMLVESKSLALDAKSNLNRLLVLDTNKDKKITVDDKIKKNFELKLLHGKTIEVEGEYFLSNLLQELKLATETSRPIESQYIFENPVDRISRLIRELYWNELTRRIDRHHLAQVLPDTKIKADHHYIYVPKRDFKALKYFQKAKLEMPELKMEVMTVPLQIDEDYLKTLEGKHGLLSLKLGVPYVVPGGRFNEMYGWDSYFETLGLIQDGRHDLAKGMIDNMVYEINHYGKILNANRSYYLSRSQPPFLTSMIRTVWNELPKPERQKKWLEESLLAAIKEYETVWMGKERLTSTGLSRYYGKSPEVPPEVEPGHFQEIFQMFAKKRKMSVKDYEKQYRTGKIQEPELDEYFIHDQAVRESGHDTTWRWRVDGKDRCADFVTVDLNSLLYKIELDIAYLIKHEFQDSFHQRKSEEFYSKAMKRKILIRELLWDKKGMFADFNFKTQKRSTYISATAFYPLWAYDPSDRYTRILNDQEASLLIKNLLVELETAGGIAASSLNSLKAAGGKMDERQWDYPNGWAPHQMIAWVGLKNYFHDKDAERLIYKWLYMITKNAMDYNGTIPEKYDVVQRSHQVFAEYGNVGTKFAYITREGFGWMNASYQVGLKTLPGPVVSKLRKLQSPDSISELSHRKPSAQNTRLNR